MQQIALPSLYRRQHPGVTQPFPLVRRHPASEPVHGEARKFFAGLLFGVLLSGTLVLLGYEARTYSDAHPGTWRAVLETVRDLGR